jgi:hypothetical protein
MKSPKLSQIVLESLRRAGFPNNQTLRWNDDTTTHQREFTYCMNAEVRSYKVQPDAEEEFSDARLLMSEIRDTLNNGNGDVMQRFVAFNSDTMIAVIFGSNSIEDDGLSHEETRRLCLRVFDGELVNPSDIDDRSAEYTKT